MYKVAIIGLGEISKYYLKALESSKSFKLVAICDKSNKKLERISIKENILKTNNFEDIKSNKNIDCVIIALPNYLHYKFCIESLNSHKHVCCEKPLTIKFKDSIEIEKISKQNKKVIFTAFHRRYNKYIHNYRIKSNKIKKVIIEYYDNVNKNSLEKKWYFNYQLSGGGCLIDSGPNALDILRHMFGIKQIKEVSIINELKYRIDSKVILSGFLKDDIPFFIYLNWNVSKEKKQISIEYFDNTIDIIDLLKGSSNSKDSMFHEYESLLNDFYSSISSNNSSSFIEIVKFIEHSYSIAKYIQE